MDLKKATGELVLGVTAEIEPSQHLTHPASNLPLA